MEAWLIEVGLFISGCILAIFQWFLKRWIDDMDESIEALQKAQKEIDKELQVIKETYVQKADMKDIKDEIVSRLSRIESFLMESKKNV